MQVSLVVERICATVFYKTYAFWNCTTTIAVIALCWIWVILLGTEMVTLTGSVVVVMFVIGILGAIIIYVILIRINYTRYHNGLAKQTLDVRHQLFENVKSLYPIVSNLIIEIVFNIHTFICVYILLYVVKPSDDIVVYEIQDSIYNIIRAIILVVYCLPFLVFTESRQKTRFLRKIDNQELNGSNLYFQQFQKHW
uniref:Serpentine receptor class gamma n=1 Tax=Panagrellus redivivus TaxID=6233 RepID=A0A7E4VU23_PANRE